jgi:ribosomal protein L5
MEIPRLNTVILSTHNISQNNIKNTSLALEIICGQKTFCTMLSNSGTQHFSSSSKRNQNFAKASKGKKRTKLNVKFNPNSQFNLAFIICSLRSRLMYNFLEKLLSFLINPKIASTSLNHFKIQINGSEIQLTLHSRELRLFPEIQNHFELFENFQRTQIKIITSAKNEKDTKLLWEGLEQK